MCDAQEWLAEKHPCYKCGKKIYHEDSKLMPRLGLGIPDPFYGAYGSDAWRNWHLKDWWCEKCYDRGMKELEAEWERRHEGGRSPIFMELKDLF